MARTGKKKHTVHPAPTPPANLPPVANFTSARNNLSITFTDASSDPDGTIVSRAWNFGDGATSTATNPVHAYASAGTYNVVLVVTDNLGATATVTKTVNPVAVVNQLPAANFTFTVNYLAVNFTDTSTDSDGTIASRLWNFGDGTTSTATNPSRTYASNGTYNVSLQVTDNSGGQATVTKQVTVAAQTFPPTASFTFTTNQLTATFTNTSVANSGTLVSYLWSFGDGTTSTQQHPVKTYGTGGAKTVQLTVRDSFNATGTVSNVINVSVGGTGQGIASRYPGDVNIGSDPAVLLFENFESYSAGLTGTPLETALKAGTNPTSAKPHGRWTKAPHQGNASIVAGTPGGEVFSGSKAWKCRIPTDVVSAQTSVEQLTLNHNQLYLRWYQKWPADYYVVQSNHNGGSFSGGDSPSGPGGNPPADGSGWWTFIADHNYGAHTDGVSGYKEQNIPAPGDSPFFYHVYAYYAGHSANKWWPDGTQVGQPGLPSFNNIAYYPNFVKQTCQPIPDRNKWYCYELMLKCNTISDGSGPHDGEIQIWIDGVSRGRFTDLYFAGTRATTGTPNLISEMRVMFHHTRQQTTDSIKYYDNIVLATEYIGPMA